MKKLSFIVSFLCLLTFLCSCSTTQDIVVVQDFINNSNLPKKPTFYSSQVIDYYQNKDLFPTQINDSKSDSIPSKAPSIFPFYSFHTISSPLNERYNCNQPYSISVKPSGYYNNQYYSSYAHGFYWGIDQPGYSSWFYLMPSAIFLNYQFTNSMAFSDRIRYQTMRNNQYCRITPNQKANTQITYYLKKTTTYSYNTKKRTSSNTGYYHYTTNTPQVLYQYPRTNNGSQNSGGESQSGNNRTRSTYSNTSVRTYTPRTSEGGSTGGGHTSSTSRQRAPAPSAIPRKF